MRNYYRQTKIGPNPGNESTRALIASGLWLRAGFIGASALFAGLSGLFGGEGNPALALALAIGGGVLAPLAWRRSRTVLDHADASAAKPTLAVRHRENDHDLESAVLR